MPQNAVKSNTVHITEICAALAAATKHDAKNMTPESNKSTILGYTNTILTLLRTALLLIFLHLRVNVAKPNLLV